MFVQTSGDLLNIVLAVAVIWIAFFLCFALYYLAAVLRRVNRFTKSVDERVERLEVAIHGIKDKLENSATYLALLAEGGKRLVEYMMEKKKEKKKKK